MRSGRSAAWEQSLCLWSPENANGQPPWQPNAGAGAASTSGISDPRTGTLQRREGKLRATLSQSPGEWLTDWTMTPRAPQPSPLRRVAAANEPAPEKLRVYGTAETF